MDVPQEQDDWGRKVAGRSRPLGQKQEEAGQGDTEQEGGDEGDEENESHEEIQRQWFGIDGTSNENPYITWLGCSVTHTYICMISACGC